MANITVQIGSDNIAIDPNNFNLKDLSKASTDLPFIFDGQLAALLEKQLSSVADGTSGSLTLDAGSPSWNLNSAVTFSLTAKASATVTVESKRPLYSYFTDFENTQPADFDGKDGTIYIIIEFSFNLSGTLSASAPVGAVGITADTSGSTSYIVRNYKAFPPTTVFKTAVCQAIAGFTLPLHVGTINNLDDGDGIFYEFDGALNVGFGATYGIGASVGGYSLSDINSTFQKIGNVANISASKGFTVGANAGVAVSFNWSRKFQCFIERTKPDAGNGSARLHLLTGQNSKRSLELSANGGITDVTAPQLNVDSATLTQWMLQKVTGQSTPFTSSVFQTPLDQMRQEVQKYVDDANQWLTSLTQKVQSYGQVSLALVFQSSNEHTSAFTWDFDAVNPTFDAAWSDAVSGDFVGAMKTGAATLSMGSGFEQTHTKSTKITLTLFGLSSFTSAETYFGKSSLRYGGHGVFYLETSTGKVASSSSKTRNTSTDVYLDGIAQSTDGGSSAAKIQIQLHGILSTKGNQDQMSRLGNLLQALGGLVPADSSAQAISLGSTFKTFARQSSSPGAAMVHIIYELSALNRLHSDAYLNGNQPKPPHLLDANNWSAYAWASGLLPSDQVAYFLSYSVFANKFYSTYDAWAAFNCLTNGYTDPDGNPTPQRKTDRHAFNYQPAISAGSSPSAAILRGFFGEGLSDRDCNELAFYFSAGQQYMNLCDDLASVVSQVSGTAVVDWTRLTTKLEQIADKDIDAWFGSSVLLALALCTKPATAVVQIAKVDPSAGSSAVVISVG
jgi:hypothetical protein